MRIEHIGDATLYLGDCKEVLPALPRAAVLAADPPYGMNLGAISGGVKDRFRRSRGFNTNYTVTGDDAPFQPGHLLDFEEIILWGGNHYASRLPDARKWLIWDKRAGGASDNQADCELAWTNLAGPARLFTLLWRGMVRAGEENVSTGSYRCHPTQKPIALMRWCLAQTTAALVIDPYMGSGTTGAAALQLGRRFVGVEIEQVHFDTACRRIEEAWKQPRLFEEPKRRMEQIAMALETYVPASPVDEGGAR